MPCRLSMPAMVSSLRQSPNLSSVEKTCASMNQSLERSQAG
jgi:hypothetical protein